MIHKILIRTDGNQQIGLGHLIRCLSLAQMLKANFEIIFFCIEIPENIIIDIKNNGFGCIKILNEDEFFSQIEPINIVIIDGYSFDKSYQRKIKNKGCQLVCIDDLHDGEFYADLIINHGPGLKPTNYKAQPYTLFALGLNYVLLRPIFLENAKKQKEKKKIENLFICFGGSDFKNLTETAIRIALEYNHFKKIIVVTGSGYLHLQSLKSLIENNSKIVHYHEINEQQMFEAIQLAELSIVPASGILLEVIALGCKVISGMYVENQKFIYHNFKQKNCFIDAINFSETSLRLAINQSSSFNTNEKIIIDGASNKRLLKIFQQLELKDQLKLRRANILDLQSSYEWAIDQLIRSFSFQQHKITFEEHSLWFKEKIRNSNCIYLIAELNNKIIGSIRFDINKKEALINYLLSPKYHGKGLGQVLLVKGIEYLVYNNLTDSIKKIVGYVMPKNIPSVNAFERLGFIKSIENNNLKFEMIL